MPELYRLTATEAARHIAAREITSEALVRSCLDRIAEREAAVQAWQFLDPELALKQARERDAKPAAGLLHGIPVGVKDIFETHDQPTDHGSALYHGNRTNTDAAAVAAVRTAGAVIIGKTVTTEFASAHPGKTRNPHNPAHTPGGSSSGSAAAVADFMVPLAFGTQTGGSVVRPAAFCGVVGFKGTHGLIGTEGIGPLAAIFDTVGGFARSVEDIALFFGALTDLPAELLPIHPHPRIALCRDPFWSAASPETQQLIEATAERFRAAGADVSEMDLPAEYADAAEVNQGLMNASVAESHVERWRAAPDKISLRFAAQIEQGLAMPPNRAAELRATVERWRLEFDELLDPFEAWLVPSAPGEAPEGLDTTGDPIMNRLWSVAGVPAINLPAGTGPNGLPLGVQLVARRDTDRTLLAVAAWAERVLAS